MRVLIELTQCYTEQCEPKEEKIAEDITWMENIIFQAILNRHPPIGNESYAIWLSKYQPRMKESPIPYEELVRAIQVDSRR